MTPYHHLIGKDISSIPIDNKHGSATAKLSQNVSIFEQVDSTSGFLPALFSSEITGLARDGDSWMAIALNGRIAAITPIFKNANQQDYTRVLLPQRFFVDGSNNFSAFIVDGTDSHISLSPVQTTSRSYMLRSDSNSTILISADGTSHEVYNDRVFGYVDDARADDRTLNFNGWAADVRSKLTVDSIIIFDGERSICVATADTPRPDVAEVFDAPEIVLSGFNASCSFVGEAPALDAIKLVGISKNGDAGIIQIPAWK